MKNLRKIVLVLVALAMVFSFCFAVSAAIGVSIGIAEEENGVQLGLGSGDAAGIAAEDNIGQLFCQLHIDLSHSQSLGHCLVAVDGNMQCRGGIFQSVGDLRHTVNALQHLCRLLCRNHWLRL